jgi:hypothetical protein
MANDIAFDDAENWSKQTIGIKEIALEQYRRCMSEGSKTFNGHDGPKQREIYINAVKSMEVILYPKILDTKNFGEINLNVVENERKIIELKNKYSETYKRMKDNNQQINEGLLNNNFEQELVDLYREKLVILSILLDKLNYFCEGSIEDY